MDDAQLQAWASPAGALMHGNRRVFVGFFDLSRRSCGKVQSCGEIHCSWLSRSLRARRPRHMGFWYSNRLYIQTQKTRRQ